METAVDVQAEKRTGITTHVAEIRKFEDKEEKAKVPCSVRCKIQCSSGLI